MTLAVLKEFVETDLPDAQLQVVLSAAEEDVTGVLGTDTSQVEELGGGGQVIWLRRAATSITTVTETDSEGTVTTLAANDYRLDPLRPRITRLNSGTNPESSWQGTVTVTYVPADLNKRNLAIVQLVELALNARPGVRTESGGEQSRSAQDYDAERERILGALPVRGLA